MIDPFEHPPTVSSHVTELNAPTLPEVTVNVTVGVAVTVTVPDTDVVPVADDCAVSDS